MDNLKNNSSPDLLVQLINEEINRVDNHSIRSGTNPWILLAAFAAIIWMIFPKIYSYSQSYLDLVLPFMILYVFYDLTTNLISTLKPSNTKNHGKNDRFQLTNINIGGNRHTILLELVKVVLILIMILHLSNIYTNSGVKILYIPYTIMALALPFLFVLSFFKVPLNAGSNKNNRIISILLTLTAILCFSIGLLFLVKISTQYVPSIDSWEISGSLLVITIIARLLANSNNDHSPLLNSLIDLRRDIILNKISFESAINQADIIFSGLSISHLLQDEVEKLLEKQRDILRILHSVANEYEATKNASLNNPTDKCTLCSSLNRSVNSSMKEVESLVGEYRKKYKKFTFRSEMLLSMSSSSEASIEWNKLNEKISHNLTNIEESLILVKEKINSFKSDLNCTQEIKQISEC